MKLSALDVAVAGTVSLELVVKIHSAADLHNFGSSVTVVEECLPMVDSDDIVEYCCSMQAKVQQDNLDFDLLNIVKYSCSMQEIEQYYS